MTTPVNLQGVELFPLQDKVDANKEEAGIENAEFQELMKDGQLKLQLPTDEEKDLVEEDAEETEALPFVHMPDLTHVGDTPITLKLRTASANYVTGVIENESSLKVAKEDTEKALLTPEQKNHLDVKLTTPAETLPELDNKSLNEDEAKAVSLALEEAQKTEKAPDLKSIVTTVTLGKNTRKPRYI